MPACMKNEMVRARFRGLRAIADAGKGGNAREKRRPTSRFVRVPLCWLPRPAPCDGMLETNYGQAGGSHLPALFDVETIAPLLISRDHSPLPRLWKKFGVAKAGANDR